MFTLRCTQKLLAWLRAAPDQEPADAATTRLGDWYANLLYLPREQVVLFVNESSLLPVVVPAQDARSLVNRMRYSLRDVLLRIGVPAEAVEAELREMALPLRELPRERPQRCGEPGHVPPTFRDDDPPGRT